jgi:hypothetical protein
MAWTKWLHFSNIYYHTWCQPLVLHRLTRSRVRHVVISDLMKSSSTAMGCPPGTLCAYKVWWRSIELFLSLNVVTYSHAQPTVLRSLAFSFRNRAYIKFNFLDYATDQLWQYIPYYRPYRTLCPGVATVINGHGDHGSILGVEVTENIIFQRQILGWGCKTY